MWHCSAGQAAAGLGSLHGRFSVFVHTRTAAAAAATRNRKRLRVFVFCLFFSLTPPLSLPALLKADTGDVSISSVKISRTTLPPPDIVVTAASVNHITKTILLAGLRPRIPLEYSKCSLNGTALRARVISPRPKTKTSCVETIIKLTIQTSIRSSFVIYIR